MDLYDLANPAERLLADKADAMRAPLGGSMELLPLCNMDCKMCYIRLSRQEMEQRGRMLSCDEWLNIAKDAKDNGVLYLLLTGGEPLIYPEFDRLYTTLLDMGFILTVNTNGTLIDEETADLFARHPCKRINVTLYGTDDDTYARLCGNPEGFSQVMRAAGLLKKKGVIFRFNCSVTPENVSQIREIAAIAKEFNVPLEACNYMFPPVRKGIKETGSCAINSAGKGQKEAKSRAIPPAGEGMEGAGRGVPEPVRKESEETGICRMHPPDAARSQLEIFSCRVNRGEFLAGVMNTMRLLERPVDNTYKGLPCRAGRSGFWMNWKGEMVPCGMFEEPGISLLEHSFGECWDYIVSETAKIRYCEDCVKCPKRGICKSCGAACLTETGSCSGKPEYLCEMTDELIRIMYGYLPDEEKEKYREILEGCGFKF